MDTNSRNILQWYFNIFNKKRSNCQNKYISIWLCAPISLTVSHTKYDEKLYYGSDVCVYVPMRICSQGAYDTARGGIRHISHMQTCTQREITKRKAYGKIRIKKKRKTKRKGVREEKRCSGIHTPDGDGVLVWDSKRKQIQWKKKCLIYYHYNQFVGNSFIKIYRRVWMRIPYVRRRRRFSEEIIWFFFLPFFACVESICWWLGGFVCCLYLFCVRLQDLFRAIFDVCGTLSFADHFPSFFGASPRWLFFFSLYIRSGFFIFLLLFRLSPFLCRISKLFVSAHKNSLMGRQYCVKKKL